MKWILPVFLAVLFPAFAQEVRRALPVEAGETSDELAKFLAGIPLPSSSVLAPLQDAPEYRTHVEELARLVRHHKENFYWKMREWSGMELYPRLRMGLPVYYFFGGPDAVSVLAYYPDAPVYILGGLEAVGSVADPRTLGMAELVGGLTNLRKSTEVILSYGHFITKDMKSDLDRSAFRGVLPLLYLFIGLTGGEILSSEFIGIGSGGVESPWKVGARAVPGVKLTFRAVPGGREKILYYVNANVADGALKPGGDVLLWAGRFGRGNVYLKAASYLMHEAYFSRIRSFLLENAASVLQDDSGIPFRFFRRDEWRIWLFGVYSGTLDIFQKYYQEDLRAAFGSVAPTVLPFGTGYKWQVGESNLMLAVRVAPMESPLYIPPKAVPVGAWEN